MQNSKCKMQNNGVRLAHVFNHFRRKYHNFAFCIQHSAFCASAGQTVISSPGNLTILLPRIKIEENRKEDCCMAINIEYLWKDRKRYFGLPLSFTRYSMSEDRLFVSVGFLNIKDDEVLLYRVRDIDTTRTLGQRIFGVGTVTVISADKTMPNLVLKNVKDPVFVKELIHKQVEEMKLRRRVRVGEIMTADADGDGEPDEDFDDDNI